MLQTWWRGEWGNLCVSVFVSFYFLYYLSTFRDWHFLDGVNLVIHEAGHIIFLPLGEFMHIAGGSLLQILVPIIFTLYFVVQRRYFSASLLLFWMGQNLLNVSVYASDAIAMQLPLLGGDNVQHDWNTILTMLHILRYTPHIGYALYVAGAMSIIAAVALSVIFSQTVGEMT